MFDNSDEYDFTPSDSSKLATLFGNFGQNDESNSSLMYTAPKQPSYHKASDKHEVSSETLKIKSQSKVLLAKIVYLWKLENTEYKALGKHGLAVIGVEDLNLFEIIGYKERTNVLLRRKVNENLSFYLQKDSFSSFYDDDSKNWLVKFQDNDQNYFCEVIKKFGAQIIVNTEEPSQNSTEDVTPKPELLPKPKFVAEDSGQLSDNSGSQQRAHILSRMAKMGQQILPKPIRKNNSTDISDSELEESECDQKRSLRKPTKNLERTYITSEKYSDNHMVPVNPAAISYSPSFSQNVLNPMVYAQHMNHETFNNYIISQNAELKMSVSQLSSKLESVLSGSCQKSEDSVLNSKVKALELKSENLQEALNTFKKKYQSLEKKYNELANKDLGEVSEKKIIINRLETEISYLKTDLAAAEEKVKDFEKLELELQQSINDIADCEKTIEIQKLKIGDLETFYYQNKDNEDLQATVDTLSDTVENLRLKLKDFEEFSKKTESEKQKRLLGNNEKINFLGDMIKMHMNEMYQSMLGSFKEDDSISFSEIQFKIAKNVKGTTFQIIEDLKAFHNEGSNNILNDQ
ncbi:hypothetical protein JTB14_000457 [Gonioctena quinquepunctata]|nr:hypothetical protein JTB14_000457 [Gonioctena quinquepunctata]